jgi:hypothetical protein
MPASTVMRASTRRPTNPKTKDDQRRRCGHRAALVEE